MKYTKAKFCRVSLFVRSAILFCACYFAYTTSHAQIVASGNALDSVRIKPSPIKPSPIENKKKGEESENQDEKDISTPKFPAVISDLRLFRLEETTKEGFNAATLIQFEKNQRSEILDDQRFETHMDKTKTAFNDLGEGADLEPGDGIFSAFTFIDFEELKKDEDIFLQRLEKSKRLVVKEFSGRSVVSSKTLTLDDLLKNKKEFSSQQIVLGQNVKAFPVNSILATLKTLPFTADEFKVLAINSTQVVAHPDFTFDPCDTDGTGNNGDPDKPWSLKTLLSNMNQGTGLSNQEFIHEWLRNWMVPSTVNGFLIPTRTGILDYFPGWDGVNAATLDIDTLPFRTTAIVPRPDLAKVSYVGSKEGEIRFVFGLLNPNTCTPAVGIDQMTAILEYGDTASSCSAIKSRAQQLLDLDTLPLGSPAYMNALKAITDDVTEAPQAATQLNQLRTNDFAFDGIASLAEPWELREFVIDSGTGLLTPTTTKQTPDVSFRTGHPDTAHFMETNANAILCESHIVTDLFNSAPFLGSSLEYFSTSFWTAPTSQANLPGAFPVCHTSNAAGVSPFVTLPTHIQSEVRHKFSVNTCDDCHAQETNTFFTHVNPVTRNFSGFMTGVTVPDPQLGGVLAGGIDREFDDLQRRGQILMEQASKSCSGPLILNTSFFEVASPLTFTH